MSFSTYYSKYEWRGIHFYDYKTNCHIGMMTFFIKWDTGLRGQTTAVVKALAIIPVNRVDQNNSNSAVIKKLVAMISDKHCRGVPFKI